MAVAPKSFISRFVRNRQKAKGRPRKKKPGFLRSALGAVAGEALSGTGHIGKHIVKKIAEDAMGSGGTPTNCASSGAIAGLGAPGSDEPGRKKKHRAPLLTYKLFKRTKGLKQ